MERACVLMVYNTLYKYFNTQRDGFSQKLPVVPACWKFYFC